MLGRKGFFQLGVFLYVFVHLSDKACVTSVKCEQRVERFLSCLGGITLCCEHLTSFNSTETFKKQCKTACPTGSFTAHTSIIIMLTCVSTIFSTVFLARFSLSIVIFFIATSSGGRCKYLTATLCLRGFACT